MYEESVRVPLLMRVPWLTDRQTMIPGRFSQIDMVPTLLDLIGESVPDHLQDKAASTFSKMTPRWMATTS